MRRFFVLFSFLLVCAIGFADQPWEDVSTYAPSFDKCKIKIWDDGSLLFNVTYGNVTFGFAINGQDEGNFLALINSDKRLKVKQSLVDAFLCDAYVNQKESCDFLVIDENGQQHMYRATSKKLVTIPRDLSSDFVGAVHKKQNPAARDWDFSGESDRKIVSRDLTAAPEKKVRPQTRDWQLPSERTDEPEKTGVFAMAEKAAEKKQLEDGMRAIAEASKAAGEDLRRSQSAPSSSPASSSSLASSSASKDATSSSQGENNEDFSLPTILMICLFMAIISRVLRKEETPEEKKKRKLRDREDALDRADRRRRDSLRRTDEARRRYEYMRDQQDRWNGLK